MTSEAQETAIRSLLVEDNPGDVRLTQEALSESAYPNELDIAEDGESAMARLLRQGEFGDAPLPDLIFLDLNLPKKDGFQVMREIKEQPHLRHIPVMMLTSSQAQEDMLISYGLAVRSYIRKPLETSRFDMMAKGLVPRLASRIEGAEAWKAMARSEAVEREEGMVLEYTELAGLSEEDRTGRMQALADAVLDLPATQRRDFALSRLKVWLRLEPEAAKRVAASYESIAAKLSGDRADAHMSLVQDLVREFSVDEQGRLIALDPTVFGGVSAEMEAASKKRWWWPFGG